MCVQGLPEAEPSGEVFKYSCQARSRLESTLELRLEGLGKLTGNETFTHDLVIPASKQSAFRNALQLVPLFGSMTDPSQPLRLFAWPFAWMEVAYVVCAQPLLPCTPCCQYSNLQPFMQLPIRLFVFCISVKVLIAMHKWSFVSWMLISLKERRPVQATEIALGRWEGKDAVCTLSVVSA